MLSTLFKICWQCFVRELHWLSRGSSGKDEKELIAMSTTRWERSPELMSLRQAMDRLLEDSFIRLSRFAVLFGETPAMPIDMYVSNLQWGNSQGFCSRDEARRHGYNHYWLNTLSKEQQKKEIEISIEFLEKIGCNINNYAFCYPYGMYNDSLLSVLKESGFSLSLTTQVRIADLSKDNPLTLPRLDANDIPNDSMAEPNKWTQEVIY